MIDVTLLAMAMMGALLFPLLLLVAIFGLAVAIYFFCGVLTEWNETHLIKRPKELSLQERVEIAINSPIDFTKG